MRPIARAGSVVARAALCCALVYVVCMQVSALLLRAITLAAAAILSLVDRPAIITGLSSDADRVLVTTHLRGFAEPLVSWDAGNLDVFLVATLGLALAMPASSGWLRLRGALVATLAGFLVMVITAVIQLQVITDNEARATLGLRLHGERGHAILGVANQWIGVMMLLLPAVVFSLAYLQLRGGHAPPGAASSAGARSIFAPGALLVLMVLALVALARLRTVDVDPRPGLLRVIELNPDAAQPRLALACHDHLSALMKTLPASVRVDGDRHRGPGGPQPGRRNAR